MSEGPVIIVKFREMAAQSERCRRLSDLVGDQLGAAEPVFPDEQEPELGSLFQITLRASAPVAEVLRQLAVDDEVEYAHEPAKRTPQRE